MNKIKIGSYIKILEMKKEPQYTDKIGKVLFIDDNNQIHGTWGGCAIIPKVDKFEVLSKENNRLFKTCEKCETSLTGMNILVDYYMESLKWSEKASVDYAISLFHNGTIRQIKMLSEDGKEL